MINQPAHSGFTVLLRARYPLLVVLAAILALFVSGCTAQPEAQAGFTVTVKADGTQSSLDVIPGATVQAALQEAGISMGNLDRVDPPGYTALTDGSVITVTRVREVFTVKENIIPFARETLNNESLPVGQELLVQRGVNGVEQLTYRQVFENEQEVSNSIFKTEVMIEPIPQIMMIGVQKPFSPVEIPGKLAYLAGGNAWVMEETTGERRPVATTGDLDGRVFSLSPKGDWLLFTRQQVAAEGEEEDETINTLWAVDLSEVEAKPVSLDVKNIIHFAGWAPGKGLTITYSTAEPSAASPGWQASNDLQMLTFSTYGTTVKQETIIEALSGGWYAWWGTDFAWSEDGVKLAYANPDAVGLVDLEEQTHAPLVNITPFQTGENWAWVTGLGWAPDSSVLYMVTHGEQSSDPNNEKDRLSPLFNLAAVPVNGGPLITMIPNVGMFAYPSPSPLMTGGGFRVAYLQSREPAQSDNQRYRLVIMDRDGSNRKEVFPPEDRQGMDPQRVVWSQEPASSGSYSIAAIYQGNLWLINADSGEAQPVTGDGLISRVDWR